MKATNSRKNFLDHLQEKFGIIGSHIRTWFRSRKVEDETIEEPVNETDGKEENIVDVVPPFKNNFDDAENYLKGLCEKKEYLEILNILSDSRIPTSSAYRNSLKMYKNEIQSLYKKYVQPRNTEQLYCLSEEILVKLNNIVKNCLIMDVVNGADTRITNNDDTYGLFQKLKDSVFAYMVSIGFYEYKDEEFDGTIRKDEYYKYYEVQKKRINNKNSDDKIVSVKRSPYIIYYYDEYGEISLDNEYYIEGVLLVQ